MCAAPRYGSHGLEGWNPAELDPEPMVLHLVYFVVVFHGAALLSVVAS